LQPNVFVEEVEVPKKKTKKEKKLSKSSSKRPPIPAEANNGEDVSMIDATPDSLASASPPAPSKAQESRQEQEQKFSTIYMKKITAELADDLDKVREAQDFTSRSLPMLIHALKQGESLFSTEEKRRVVGAVN
jgi:ribosome assembly protein 3